MYLDLSTKMPLSIDWNELQQYEKGDTTTGTQELACTGGVCEIVDIGA
jgi:ribonucleoside-triphosphate reductase